MNSPKRFLWISVSILLLAAGCNRGPDAKNTEVSGNQPPVSKTASWSTYTDSSLGFEVKYPSDIFKLDTKSARLSHTLKNFHLTSDKDGSDLGPASDMTLTFKKDARPCQELSNSVPSLAKPYKVNGLDALKYETGAEGRGIVYYCLTHEFSGLGIFLIERAYLHESYSTDVIKQPDFMAAQQQEALAEQILNTFVLTNDPVEGTTKIKLYFVDKNKETVTCNEVVAVERTVAKTPRIATAAINALLAGPTAAERKKGYATIIPEGSRLNSLAIANGEARADFNAVTESGGGSCGMGMLTAQISKTLKQFPTVKTVRLSIEGRTDDIFQP